MEAPLPGAPAGSGQYRRESTGDQINTQKKGKSHNKRIACNSQTAHICKHLDCPQRNSLVSQGFFKLEKSTQSFPCHQAELFWECVLCREVT